MDLESEEKEVRRVLSQRGLRVNARVQAANFIALSAASRDGHASALRVITARGVVAAEDAQADDLFQPSRIMLLEHFGGTIGEFTLLAFSRVSAGLDMGCVTLLRILPTLNAAPSVLDVSELGARACVSNLAPARNGRMRATVAWPSLHALRTPTIDVELAFDDPYEGRAARLLDEEPVPVSFVPIARISKQGDWIERERYRLSTAPLAKAEFSHRHAIGVARAAMARLEGKDLGSQLDAYRNAIGELLPGSPEAQIVGDTLHHIQQNWLDSPGAENKPLPEPEPAPEDATVIEPEP